MAPGNLPLALSSFIGRGREIMEVKRLLAATRLLTLTGAGGSGKTRLALWVAAELAADFADGAWLVELAPLADPALVPQTVLARSACASRRASPPPRRLADHLREKRLLLVLDNCEHLVGACAELAEALLRACPGLRILATSREPLGIAGEMTWRVPSLAVPDRPPRPRAGAPRARVDGGAPVRRPRAAAVQPDFALTAPNAAAVAEICRRLDGIPLALELAAARVRALPVEQIAGAAGRPLPAADRRQPDGPAAASRRCAATLDWSHDLLAEPERALLRRLAVFAGGWTLEAAEAVCAGEDRRQRGARPAGARWWTSRWCWSSQRRRRGALPPAGDGAPVRPREAAARPARPSRCATATWTGAWRWPSRPSRPLRGADQVDWLRALDAEHDNLRAALEHGRARPEPACAWRRPAGASGGCTAT